MSILPGWAANCDLVSSQLRRQPVASGAMNETIRAYIKRRVRWCLAIGIGGLVVIATSIGARVDNPMVSILGFLTFGGAILAMQWIKCPRCSVRLGQIAVTLAVPGLKPQPNFAPIAVSPSTSHGPSRPGRPARTGQPDQLVEGSATAGYGGRSDPI